MDGRDEGEMIMSQRQRMKPQPRFAQTGQSAIRAKVVRSLAHTSPFIHIRTFFSRLELSLSPLPLSLRESFHLLQLIIVFTLRKCESDAISRAAAGASSAVVDFALRDQCRPPLEKTLASQMQKIRPLIDAFLNAKIQKNRKGASSAWRGEGGRGKKKQRIRGKDYK
jgi:hypothetical protein